MPKKVFLLLLLCSGIVANCYSQSFSATEKLQGYSLSGDQVTFIFDKKSYGVTPERVLVTGAFRGWDSSLHTEEWELKEIDGLWLLSINNEDFGKLQPNTPFKYRINTGEWLQPPAAAENVRDGNLVFEKRDQLLKAELRSEYLIWAEIKANRSLEPSDYKITDAQGNEIAVAQVLPHDATATLIIPAKPLDKKRVYYLEAPAMNWKTHCSFDGWFREVYSSKELGANVNGNKTAIRLFAPRAEMVKLYLYKGKDDKEAYLTREMKEGDQGVWEMQFSQDLHGTYYDFTIHGADDPGNHFYDTNPVHVNDPYARVVNETWGKGRIWRKTQAATPLKNGIPKMEEVIAYEVHIQDFTQDLPIENKDKGTFQGMITPDLVNENKEKIGFDYLVDLGINTVHLMPVQEYVHFPDADWKASFQNDEYMIREGISEENYQWGYRTSFAMAVEAKYRTKGKAPGAERDEFRDLVQAFHEKDIAVIIDIVPNHTAENMTENEWYFNFNAIDKQYYYRTKDFAHIGAYGNEVKTENRPMVQRWLIDQCKHFIEEFGIDGFRIDLAGQIDEQTLIALKAALGEDIILYGEPWIGSNDPNYEDNPDWDWYKEDSPITFFQDDLRNAYKGPVFELNSKEKDRGWPGGKYDERDNVVKALPNKFKEDKTPLSGISYLDIHDNFALADQFATEGFDGRFSVDQDLYKIAVTLLYTTLGPIVTHGGSEIMRSKGHSPLEEVVKETGAGHKQYMHGKRDTYNLRTANKFLWETVGQTPTASNTNDYKNMQAFWKGMNQFRLSDYGKVFRVSEAVSDGYYQFILPEDESLLGYVVNDEVLVLLNASEQEKRFDQIVVPTGKWKLIANTKKVDHRRGVKSAGIPGSIKGGTTLGVKLEPSSLLIWVKEK